MNPYDAFLMRAGGGMPAPSSLITPNMQTMAPGMAMPQAPQMPVGPDQVVGVIPPPTGATSLTQPVNPSPTQYTMPGAGGGGGGGASDAYTRFLQQMGGGSMPAGAMPGGERLPASMAALSGSNPGFGGYDTGVQAARRLLGLA